MSGRAIVVTILGALLAPAAATAAPPRLAGTTEISGSHSGFVEVQIPEKVRLSTAFDASENTTFKFSGGSFSAVALKRLDGPAAEQAVIAAARFAPELICPTCPRPVETVSAGFSNIGTQATADHTWEFPAGRYRLYLLTDGTPTTATIRMTALTGRLSLQPEFAVPAPRVLSLPRRDGLATAHESWFGATGRLDRAGIVLSGGLAYAGTDGDVEIFGCFHEGEGEGAGAFAPGCPGGQASGSHGFTFLAQEEPTFVGAGFMLDSEKGNWAAGGSVSAASPDVTTGWAAAWIHYDGDGRRVPGGPVSGGAPTPLPPSSGQPRGAPPTSSLVTRRARLQRGRATLRVRCSGRGTCTGTLGFSRERAARYTVPAGRTLSVKLRVPRSIAAKVRRRGRAKVQVRLDGRRLQVELRR